jgi:hypothetical protein
MSFPPFRSTENHKTEAISLRVVARRKGESTAVEDPHGSRIMIEVRAIQGFLMLRRRLRDGWLSFTISTTKYEKVVSQHEEFIHGSAQVYPLAFLYLLAT